MAILHVNVDHVATVRQARQTIEPDPVHMALRAEMAGASGITIHLREDRRHIQDRDVMLIREMIHSTMNLEMGATDEMVEIAVKTKPDIVTLVPESRQEVTTEGGLDCLKNFDSLKEKIARLHAAGIRVSLFIDPVKAQISAAKDLQADDIELHTGEYANAANSEDKKNQLDRLTKSTQFAIEQGMQVNAGHGLTYYNVKEVAAIPGIKELNIGHSIIARSLFVGVEQAVKEMLDLIS